MTTGPSLPASLDPLQFAYRPSRSTEDAINRLITKLQGLRLTSSLCRWVHSFLTSRPQVVRVGKHLSNSRTLNIGVPQGCVLSPLLYSLYTHDCLSTSDSNIIINFTDDTAVVGLISNNNKEDYLMEIAHLEDWRRDNSLLLNISKTKELIVDYSKKQQRAYHPLGISGTEVERVESFKYLSVNITQDLTWSCHINTLVKKAQQRLYHLRCLRDFQLPPLKVLRNFYTCTTESILAGSISTWMGSSTQQDFMALRRVVRTTLPNLQDMYNKRCRLKARKIVSESTSATD